MRPEDLELAHVVHGAWGVESPTGFLTVVSAARTWAGELRNREPGKHTQVQWVDVDALPDAMVPSNGRVLRRYVEGRAPGVLLRGWP